MDFKKTIEQLAQYGTDQNIKVYKRHGASEPMFGVSFTNLKKMKKQIKTDHDLGLALWHSGNMDAQTLALMVMDPACVTGDKIDSWIEGLGYYMLVDLLVSEIVMETSFAEDRLKKWTCSKKEYVKRAGYSILTNFSRRESSLSDTDFIGYLERIKEEIHESPNRAKQMMNIAVLNIGLRNAHLHAAALKTARAIGRVDVDHGETHCKTFDAAARLSDEHYLAKSRKSRRHKPVPKKTAVSAR